MFKKIEIWILYLAILFGFLFAVAFGILVRQELIGTIKVGLLSKTALELAEIPVNASRYLDNKKNPFIVEDRYPSIKGFEGTPNAKEAYLLLPLIKKNGTVVELVDLTNFETIHTWKPDIKKFNEKLQLVDEFKNYARNNSNYRTMIKHPKITPDGGIIFGWNGPLRKIDVCSSLVFQNQHDIFHHSVETDFEGNIWVPTHMYPQSLPQEKVGRVIPNENGFRDDAIVKLNKYGRVIYEKSVAQIFIENNMKYLLFAHGNSYEADPIHLNDIQPVNFDGKYWKKGDVFLSLRNQSMIVLFRPSNNQIIWKMTGSLLHQHDVDIVDNHRISIFNNNMINKWGDKKEVDGYNQVIIYDFENQKTEYKMKESLTSENVKTKFQGSSEILPNGDMLVEESNFGRMLYFNSDGSVRWQYVSRDENGEATEGGWSRILYTNKDIKTVREIITKKGKCNE